MDHTLIWRDHAQRYIVTTEPYGGREASIRAWAADAGWTAYRMPEGHGMWNPPDTQLWILAPPTRGGSVADIAERLAAARGELAEPDRVCVACDHATTQANCAMRCHRRSVETLHHQTCGDWMARADHAGMTIAALVARVRIGGGSLEVRGTRELHVGGDLPFYIERAVMDRAVEITDHLAGGDA